MHCNGVFIEGNIGLVWVYVEVRSLHILHFTLSGMINNISGFQKKKKLMQGTDIVLLHISTSDHYEMKYYIFLKEINLE